MFKKLHKAVVAAQKKPTDGNLADVERLGADCEAIVLRLIRELPEKGQASDAGYEEFAKSLAFLADAVGPKNGVAGYARDASKLANQFREDVRTRANQITLRMKRLHGQLVLIDRRLEALGNDLENWAKQNGEKKEYDELRKVQNELNKLREGCEREYKALAYEMRKLPI